MYIVYNFMIVFLIKIILVKEGFILVAAEVVAVFLSAMVKLNLNPEIR